MYLNPFVSSVDGLLGFKAEIKLKHNAIRLTTKWKEPYSRIFMYVKSRFVITLVQAAHCCIWRARVLASQIIVKRPQWEDGAFLYIFR